MRRDLRLLGAAAVALVALAVPALLVSRVLPARAETELIEGVSGSAPVRLQRAPSGGERLDVATPRFSALRGTRVEVVVATYLRRPSETIVLVLRGASGERIGSCRVPPSAYADNGSVGCPVARPERLRGIRISVRGKAPLAVYANNEGGRLVAGRLARQRHFMTLFARLREVEARVGVTRPAPFTPVVMFVSLIASIALFAGASLLLLDQIGRER
jgi:hypothetical protein